MSRIRLSLSLLPLAFVVQGNTCLWLVHGAELALMPMPDLIRKIILRLLSPSFDAMVTLLPPLSPRAVAIIRTKLSFVVVLTGYSLLVLLSDCRLGEEWILCGYLYHIRCSPLNADTYWLQLWENQISKVSNTSSEPCYSGGYWYRLTLKGMLCSS